MLMGAERASCGIDKNKQYHATAGTMMPRKGGRESLIFRGLDHCALKWEMIKSFSKAAASA